MNDSEKNHLAYGLASAYSSLYEQFGWINMRTVTFSFVDQSSSRCLKKFGEKISPDVIDMHTLKFKPNFKFSRLFFFLGGGPRPNWGVR